jgi:hypothetical protein
MARQRVKALRFHAGGDDHTTYEVAGSREFDTLYGRFHLEQDALTVWPVQDFDDVEAAVEQLAPFLRSWEIGAGLEFGPDSLRFTYEAADLEQIGTESGMGGSGSVSVELQSGLVVGDAAAGHLTRHHYPSPPAQGEFAMSEHLGLAYHRWRSYVRKQEPLPSMAYFICTIFEELAGSRKEAAKTFGIDYKVLDTVARLSSNSGGASSLRKFAAGKPPVEMPDAERAWLEEALKRLIRRLGEYAAAAPLVRIAMVDFPTLP